MSNASEARRQVAKENAVQKERDKEKIRKLKLESKPPTADKRPKN